MERITSADHREAIAEALWRIPDGIVARLRGVDFLTGVDPLFAGLHRIEAASFGRSYRNIAHCAYPAHTSDRSTTIAIPGRAERPHIIVHELGHALDYTLDFEHDAVPVTAYARTDRYEAFAEAFTTWLHHGYGAEDIAWADQPTLRLFETLAA